MKNKVQTGIEIKKIHPFEQCLTQPDFRKQKKHKTRDLAIYSEPLRYRTPAPVFFARLKKGNYFVSITERHELQNFSKQHEHIIIKFDNIDIRTRVNNIELKNICRHANIIDEYNTIGTTTFNKITKKHHSRLPLALSMSIISLLMASSFIGLPEPFNYIACLALAGPLSASMMGFRR